MSTEARLAQMLSEMNESRRGGEAGKLVCETECTMSRIRSYSDFLYILRVKPLQTVCYYGAGAFLLLTLSALWCREWTLKQAEAQAAKRRDEILAKAAKDCDALKKDAGARLDKAAKAILGRVVDS